MIDLEGPARRAGVLRQPRCTSSAAGSSSSRVDLKDAKDEAEFGRRLVEFDKNTPRDRWLLGGNWDHDRTFGGQAADRRDHRQVRQGPARLHPPLRRAHGARQLRGAQARGRHRRHEGRARRRHLPLADGKTPSGVLSDNAMSLVGRLIPEPDDEEILEAVLAAQKHAAELGVTSVQDMDGSGAGDAAQAVPRLPAARPRRAS